MTLSRNMNMLHRDMANRPGDTILFFCLLRPISTDTMALKTCTATYEATLLWGSGEASSDGLELMTLSL